MKGNPAVPGGPLTSKPTRLKHPWVHDRVGFFVPGGAGRPQQAETKTKGQQMFTIGRTVLGLVLLVLCSAAPLACGGSSESPRKETTVGGQYGVVVEHGGGEGSEVRIGGPKGIVVEH
jgi:hypothetical protein